ncbi:Znf1 [Magnaporthiopsis poae ATCC 64411]|uniref:Znf1 n=1 Tax=Magnaporthiopsis poae (strain ATCC 64411 / 73-15) TaxID=644358 RepID=A0A0C4ECC1_MAGP6|nr:Znf1 [Magnaporthiopsis poae ATCC 64411]
MGVPANQSFPSKGKGIPSKSATRSKPAPKAAGGVRKRTQKPALPAALREAVERHRAPQSFYPIYERATSQRFFVLSRTRCGTDDCPEEKVELAGSTGNIYNIHIARWPKCDCPHYRNGNQCKHLLYVMSRVLRARFNLVYQLALLSSELREIFDKAPPLPGTQENTCAEQGDHNRKPVEGDCPICFDELPSAADAAKSTKNCEQLVWCRAACGQNMHKHCFQMWSATKRQQAGGSSPVTCPFCRSVWEEDADDSVVKDLKKDGPLNQDGYVNVADQLGISPVRDYSTYSEWWGGGRPSYSGRRRY